MKYVKSTVIRQHYKRRRYDKVLWYFLAGQYYIDYVEERGNSVVTDVLRYRLYESRTPWFVRSMCAALPSCRIEVELIFQECIRQRRYADAMYMLGKQIK